MRKTHFKKEWSKEKCLKILRDYETKIRGLEKRPRGNTTRVIHAVQCLNGMFKTGRYCEECTHRKEYDVDLHHVDRNWKNYSPKNLRFLCKSHHHLAHVEPDVLWMFVEKNR